MTQFKQNRRNITQPDRAVAYAYIGHKDQRTLQRKVVSSRALCAGRGVQLAREFAGIEGQAFINGETSIPAFVKPSVAPATPTSVVPVPKTQPFNIGLTSVKGRIESATDVLVNEADALYKQGKFPEAQAKYDQALTQGAEKLKSVFSGTGIDIKIKGTGFGIYKGGREPNFDAIAMVPAGKEDFFHYILSEYANEYGHQNAVFTYRFLPATSETPLGVTNAAKGMSNMPYVRITAEKPLTLAEVQTIEQEAADLGISDVSMREGGTAIDIVASDATIEGHAQFTKNAEFLQENLNSRGISGSLELGASETRSIGYSPSEGHGAVGYTEFQNTFRGENLGYVASKYFTSKVIEKLK